VEAEEEPGQGRAGAKDERQFPWIVARPPRCDGESVRRHEGERRQAEARSAPVDEQRALRRRLRGVRVGIGAGRDSAARLLHGRVTCGTTRHPLLVE
jgi:hypothetical protein